MKLESLRLFCTVHEQQKQMEGDAGLSQLRAVAATASPLSSSFHRNLNNKTKTKKKKKTITRSNPISIEQSRCCCC